MATSLPLPEMARSWAEHQLGRKVLSDRELGGATTAQIHVLTTEAGDYVFKRFTYESFVVEEPDRAIHEASGAQAAIAAGAPVPRVIAIDPDGEASGVPGVLMTKLPGEPLVSIDHPEAISGLLAHIHQLDARLPWEFDRYNPPLGLYPPPWAADTAVWEKAFDVVAESTPDTPHGFMHRDFHHYNLLWVGDQVTGVVDWLSACMGPFAIDIARCRLNLAWIGDWSGSARFLSEYRRIGIEGADHPYWDLVDAIDALPYYEGPDAVARWPLPGRPEETRARHERFMSDALGCL